MNILDALRDPALFGTAAAFRDLSTWRAWLVFLAAFYGLPVDAQPPELLPDADDTVTLGPEVDSGLDLFRRHTGRRNVREGGYSEAAMIVGRQAGKTQVAALVGAWEAARATLSGERGVYVPLIAQDFRAAQRTLFGYVRDLVTGSPLLEREVTRETTTEIELAGRVTIAVYPARPQSVRGVRAACAVVDELAHYVSTDGRPLDSMMLTAIRPTLATTGGRLLILSSPYHAAGALHELYSRNHGREESKMLVWQATALSMNGSLSPDYLEKMKTEDPLAYQSEVLGEFRSGTSALFDSEVLDGAVDAGVRERLPVQGETYFAHFDPSGGRRDAAALAIARRSGGARTLDFLRAWPSPHNPGEVVAEAATELKRYGLSCVQVDRFGGEYPVEQFRLNGVTAETAPTSTSDTYVALVPLVNSDTVRLLDVPELLRELRALERRRGSAGKDRVDHPRGRHDDRAAAAAGALVAASEPEQAELSLTW